MNHLRFLRKAFIAIVGLFLFTLLIAAAVRNIYLTDTGLNRYGIIAKPLRFMAELPSTVKRVFETPGFYTPNTTASDGVSYVNSTQKGDYPKLLVTYKTAPFAQVVDLVDLNSGETLKTWAPDNAAIYSQGYNESNPRKPAKGSDLYFMHPLMLQDSSLLMAAQLSSILVKINPDNSVAWQKSDMRYHHSLELGNDGMLWISTDPFEAKAYDIFPDSHGTYKSTLLDDEITKIDPETGDVLYQKKVIELLIENGYEDLILYKGQIISDPVHLNDIEEASTSTDYWEKGDLLLSCRNLSVVLLYRPSTNKVIWLKHGPWYNQHDADFHGDSQIVVFGNDVFREESTIDPKLVKKNMTFSKNRPNNEVYIYDFAQDTVITPYSRMLATEKIMTATSGRCDILENGDLFAEDTNNGRIVIGDTLQKKLEFVKRIDESHISSLFWSRIIN